MNVSINQTTSPIKLAFFVKPNSRRSFIRAMQTCYSVWGGIYAPILPYYKKFSDSFRQEYYASLGSNDFYIGAMGNYDPDLVVYDAELGESNIALVAGDRQIITTEEFIETLKNGRNAGISILDIINVVIDQEFKFKRTDNLQIIIPEINDTDLFMTLNYGSPLPFITDELKRLAEDHNFVSRVKVSLKDQNEYIIQNAIPFSDFHTYKLKTLSKRFSSSQSIIYVIDPNRLLDIINVWNLRALGWLVIAIPIEEIDSDFYDEEIKLYCHWFSEKHPSQMLLFYGSVTLRNSRLNYFASKISKIIADLNKGVSVTFQSWFPRFWESGEINKADNVSCTNIEIGSSFSYVEIDTNYFSFTSHPLPFETNPGNFGRALYKLNVDFSYDDYEINYPEIIHGIKSIDWSRLTHSSGYKESWRVAKSGLIFYCTASDDTVDVFIPQSFDFFKKYFQNNQLDIKELPAGKLAREVLKNLKGYIGARFLNSKEAMEIVALFENGKTVLYETLKAKIRQYKPNKIDTNPEVFIEQLLNRKIIEFGVEIQCSICNQHSFYQITNLNSDEIKCSVCQTLFKLPQATPKETYKWAYRGLGPFSRNNKVSGLLCEIFTLSFLSEEISSSMRGISALMNFEIDKGFSLPHEVDLAVLVKDISNHDDMPDLIICECKTYKKITLVDIERMKNIGIKFPNAILALCTLNDSLDDNEQKLIKKLITHFRKGEGRRPLNPILILASNELIPQESWKPYAELGDIHVYSRNNDWLGNLCELSNKRYLPGFKTWGELRMDQFAKGRQNKGNVPAK